MSVPCIICNNSVSNRIYPVKELQLGLGDIFHYQLCGSCNSLQLLDPPVDMGKYYPNEDYYSFNLALNSHHKRNIIRKIKTDYLLFNKQRIIGKLLSIGYKMNETLEWMKFTGAQYNDAILDVGTGNGSLLTKLYKTGFSNLTGIDPFINESKDYGAIKVLKKDIFDMEGRYDVVMMHHSLEHTFEPQKVLSKIYSLLPSGGKLLVRVPVMGNYGWRHYGEYWCGIDAPRHIFIPSENGLKKLVQDMGFAIEKFYYDSYDYVIWSSEQYKKGIPLHAPNSYMINKNASIFTKKQVYNFRKIMMEQNIINKGDMAAIYLRK